MKNWGMRIWLLISVVCAVLLGRFLARGDAGQRAERQKNWETLAAMPETDRERLDRNFLVFQALPAAQQEELRLFRQEIEADQQQQQGQLAKTLDAYDAWLKTIEQFQRNRLAKIDSAPKRIAEMRQILARQREQSADRATRNPRSEHESRWHQFIESLPYLDSEKLAEVMGHLESLVTPRLEEPQRQKLASMSGVPRYVQLLQFLVELDPQQRPLLFRSNAVPPHWEGPDELKQLASEIDQYVQDPKVLSFLDGIPPEGSPPPEEHPGPDLPPPREVQLSVVIQKSMWMQLFAEKRIVRDRITNEQVEDYFMTLSDEEQDKLLALDASDFHADVRNQLLSYQETGKAIHEIFWGPKDRGGPNGREGEGRGGFRRDREFNGPPRDRNREDRFNQDPGRRGPRDDGLDAVEDRRGPMNDRKSRPEERRGPPDDRRGPPENRRFEGRGPQNGPPLREPGPPPGRRPPSPVNDNNSAAETENR